MKKPDTKIGKFFLVFVGVCIAVLPFIVISAFSYEFEDQRQMPFEETGRFDFDHDGKSIFASSSRVTSDYLGAASTERTLSEYYSRRQYLGSPPWIPHEVEKYNDGGSECLACHAKGGWSQEFKRNAPVTPHPDQTYCGQCHVKMTTDDLFMANDWMSLPPPKLGRSHIPGGPPPIPHELQMRGDCVACHVGPGAVDSIRVNHLWRGNCRQCHVPDSLPVSFQRTSKSE